MSSRAPTYLGSYRKFDDDAIGGVRTWLLTKTTRELVEILRLAPKDGELYWAAMTEHWVRTCEVPSAWPAMLSDQDEGT